MAQYMMQYIYNFLLLIIAYILFLVHKMAGLCETAGIHKVARTYSRAHGSREKNIASLARKTLVIDGSNVMLTGTISRTDKKRNDAFLAMDVIPKLRIMLNFIKEKYGGYDEYVLVLKSSKYLNPKHNSLLKELSGEYDMPIYMAHSHYDTADKMYHFMKGRDDAYLVYLYYKAVNNGQNVEILSNDKFRDIHNFASINPFTLYKITSGGIDSEVFNPAEHTYIYKSLRKELLNIRRQPHIFPLPGV